MDSALENSSFLMDLFLIKLRFSNVFGVLKNAGFLMNSVS
jgi:hypothetical protein